MGVPKLNKLLIEKCSQKAIYKIHLENLYKKKVAVDISIYLYRFLGEGNFMENLYLFLSIFKYYCIEPIFIFDGKPPPEKQDTIKKRNQEKQTAKSEYDKLSEELDSTIDENTSILLEKRMAVLKKKMIRVKWEHIDKAIELIGSFGFIHHLAPHEADQLCVHLAKNGDVYAIISDDMDMIISGCSHVIRNINMSTHEATIYHNDIILRELNLTLKDFRQIIILSGTDYDGANKYPCISIKRAFDIYYEYVKSKTDITFYQWLCSQNLISDDFMNIYNLFETNNYADELNNFLKTAAPSPKKICVSAIKIIMRPYRFIFL